MNKPFNPPLWFTLALGGVCVGSTVGFVAAPLCTSVVMSSLVQAAHVKPDPDSTGLSTTLVMCGAVLKFVQIMCSQRD